MKDFKRNRFFTSKVHIVLFDKTLRIHMSVGCGVCECVGSGRFKR